MLGRLEEHPSGCSLRRALQNNHTYIPVCDSRDVTLVTLGLDNAGKSTVISVIMNSEFHLNTNIHAHVALGVARSFISDNVSSDVRLFMCR